MTDVPPGPDGAHERSRQTRPAIAGLWEQYRDKVIARLDPIEAAILALMEDQLDARQRKLAEQEAHKLAGSVGTFGFRAGSVIARELEHAFAPGDPLAPEDALRLSELAVALRHQLEAGEAPTIDAAPQEAPALAVRFLIVCADRDLSERIAIAAVGRDVGVVTVPDATAALAQLDAARPEAAIIDMDAAGEAIAALLARAAALVPPLPVVALASDAGLDTRLAVSRVGGRVFLSKPVSPGRVIDAAQQLMRDAPAHVVRILALDDDVVVLGTLKTILEPYGVNLSTINDPLLFWESLEEAAPDLLIVDIDMPHASGIDICRVVRSDPRWTRLPLIVLTGNTDAATVQRVFEAGADDFVAKPVAGPELWSRIENRLDRVQLFRRLAEQDDTTGLASRAPAERQLDRMLEASRRSLRPAAIAVLCVDDFAGVSQRHGHAASDRVLRRIGELLTRSSEADSVIARWSASEFVIGLPATGRDDAVRMTEAVLARVREEMVTTASGTVIRVTMSAAVVEHPADGEDIPALYRAARSAVERAVAGGGDRVLTPTVESADSAAEDRTDILLVEDDDALAGLLIHAFETRGLDIRQVRDGAEALSMLIGPGRRLHARAVLLDVGLPGLDGLSVLRELGNAGFTRTTPVIMLTARSAEAEVVKALELGAFDHVAKPFSVPVLLERVRRAMERPA